MLFYAMSNLGLYVILSCAPNRFYAYANLLVNSSHYVA